MTDDLFTFEMTRRERTVLLLGLAALVHHVEKESRDLGAPGIPAPTLDEIREISAAMWPEQSAESLRTQNIPS